jgi:hypothetical protein
MQFLENELKVAASPAIADIRARDRADVYATEVETGHEIKSSEGDPRRKRSRLN